MEDEEYLDPDDVGLRDSPPPKPMKVNLEPSPSPPPAVPAPKEQTPDPPDGKASKRRKYRPSQGDAVLVSFMSGRSEHGDIARTAGEKPLASDGEGEEEGTEAETMLVGKKDEADPDRNGIGLADLAAKALSQTLKSPIEPAQEEATPATTKLNIPSAGKSIEGLKPIIPSSDPPRGLPPIRQRSPHSALPNRDDTGQITLPSISDQLITSPRPLQQKTRPSALPCDRLRGFRPFLEMGHQIKLFIENYLHLAEGTSTLMQKVTESHLRLMSHNIRAPAMIAVATRRLQVQTSQALLLQQ
jgi:hypothetical protein